MGKEGSRNPDEGSSIQYEQGNFNEYAKLQDELSELLKRKFDFDPKTGDIHELRTGNRKLTIQLQQLYLKTQNGIEYYSHTAGKLRKKPEAIGDLRKNLDRIVKELKEE